MTRNSGNDWRKHISGYDKRRSVDLSQPFVTLKEYAAMEHIQPCSVYRRLAQRKIKGFKLGGRWYIYTPNLGIYP
ncbi:MAG: hypothetical protein F6K65_34860 [Moorea sp. SIO3C2]|nr:hypothetical protein [Moorena sp. SIO3C2]